jgi:hypothetical protein
MHKYKRNTNTKGIQIQKEYKYKRELLIGGKEDAIHLNKTPPHPASHPIQYASPDHSSIQSDSQANEGNLEHYYIPQQQRSKQETACFLDLHERK